MDIAIEITDQLLYTANVDHVDIKSLKAESRELFSGLINIHSKARGMIPFYGLIESSDFEEEFGFVLASQDYTTVSC